MHTVPRLAAVAVAVTLASAAAHAASCFDTIVSTSQLSRFAGIVQQSGLGPQVMNGALTVFAPTNDALNSISSITQMLSGQSANASPDFPKLQTLVRAHLVSGLHPENAMRGKVTLSTLAGTSLAIDGTGARGITLSSSAPNAVNLSGMRIMSDVHVAGPAIACDNGVIYPVDNALVQ